jgi:hypothetical protein
MVVAGRLVVLHKSMIPSGLNDVLLWGPEGPMAAPWKSARNDRRARFAVEGEVHYNHCMSCCPHPLTAPFWSCQ